MNTIELNKNEYKKLQKVAEYTGKQPNEIIKDEIERQYKEYASDILATVNTLLDGEKEGEPSILSLIAGDLQKASHFLEATGNPNAERLKQLVNSYESQLDELHKLIKITQAEALQTVNK